MVVTLMNQLVDSEEFATLGAQNELTDSHSDLLMADSIRLGYTRKFTSLVPILLPIVSDIKPRGR